MALFDAIKKKLKKTSPKSRPTGDVPSVETKKKVPLKKGKKPPSGRSAVGRKNLAQQAQFSHILLHPLVTEKSAHLASDNKYMFRVHAKANKTEIKKAVHVLYDIAPMRVHVLNNTGKKVRSGRVLGQRINTKKAIVTLPQGKTLDIYEGT